MTELVERIEGVRIRDKIIGGILKDTGVVNHHGRKRWSREHMERFGNLVLMDVTLFKWLGDGTQWSLHGAIDDVTVTVLGR